MSSERGVPCFIRPMPQRWELSRRAFLRGSGAVLALPFLDAMLPSWVRAASSGAAPRRFLGFFVPCGIHMRAWTPQNEGALGALPPILEPLAPVKDQLLVVSGLESRAGSAGLDGPGDHARGTAVFLTATRIVKTEGADIHNGVSADQVIANHLRARTRFPSLELGMEGGGSTGDCDSGYSCAYPRNISWSGPASPLPKEVNPALAFERLFGNGSSDLSPEEQARLAAERKSVLDAAWEDAKGLRGRLGSRDRQKLDEYLTGLRELEQRVQGRNPGASCAGMTRPSGVGDLNEMMRQMCDLIVAAFQCDLTRVVTFMSANGGSNRPYPFLGISRGHHEISHHQDNPDNFKDLQTINTWEMGHFSYLLQKMKAVQEPDGNLLDNSIAFLGSEIEDGNSHAHSNMPVLVAGRAGGKFSPGRHLRVAKDSPIANLFIAFYEALGVPLRSFGDDGSTPLQGLA